MSVCPSLNSATFLNRMQILIWAFISGQIKLSFPSTTPHHLNIYISQKNRLWLVNLEGQFQTGLEAKLTTFLIWKLISIILSFFFYFLQELSNPVLFAPCCCYSKELKYYWNCNLTQKHDSNISIFLKQHQQCQKALDLTIPAKTRIKLSIIDLNFQITKFVGLYACLKLAFQHSLFFCEM